MDHAGRQIKTIRNYDDGDPTNGDPDQDVTVEYTYNPDGNVKTITARQLDPNDDQVTRYSYGVGKFAGSELNSNNLLHTVKYPDSADSTDLVTYNYNRQGQPISLKDQNGSIHNYDYDKLGRQTHDRVITLASGVDGAVRRISTTYEVRGLVEKITSYDNAAVGSGSVVNEVQQAYNDFSQLTTQYQEHAAAVNTGTSPKVQYTYADGSSNHIRPTKLTYPDGRIVRYEYGSATADDYLSRVSYLADDSSGSIGTHLAEYTYVGMGMVVQVDYTEPDIRLDLVTGAGSDPYDGLDRFDRVVDHLWRDYGGSADVVRIQHGYDAAGNRLWREDPVAAANSVDLDELYTYDRVYQLATFRRGDLVSTKDDIDTGTLTFEQDWTLDPLGNWTAFTEDSDGDGTFDLEQTRAHNAVNEITDIDETSGASWVTPAYDRNGNMTTLPQPADPTASYAATYDAWNRLVKLVDGSDTVAEYAYDGMKWRTVVKSYASGTLSETRHCYYTSQWQAIEERVGSSTDAERQFVWGLRYIDDLVLRDRDTDANGTLDERLYGLQDPNWNLVAVADTGGTIQERFDYEAYGTPTVLTGSFGSRSATLCDWETRYAGYRWDAASGGAYYVRHRYLYPNLGRWITRDPLGELNPTLAYRYCQAMTITFTDPHGLLEGANCTVKYCGRMLGQFKSSQLYGTFYNKGVLQTVMPGTPKPRATQGVAIGIGFFEDREESSKCCDRFRIVQAAYESSGEKGLDLPTLPTVPWYPGYTIEDGRIRKPASPPGFKRLPPEVWGVLIRARVAIIDRPTVGDLAARGATYTAKFETCLVCQRTAAADKILTCITWGYRRKRISETVYGDAIPINPICAEKPSLRFFQAISDFNSQLPDDAPRFTPN